MRTSTWRPLRAALILVSLVAAVASVACGGGDKQPTFQQQRDKAAAFLRQLNQATNNFEDAYNSAGINQKIASGKALQINAALTTLTQQMDGYQKQVNEMIAPPEVPEAATLKAALLTVTGKFQQAIQQMRTAIQTGNQSEILRAAEQLDQLDVDPDAKRPDELEQALLAKFNIPDTEVSYRRPPQ